MLQKFRWTFSIPIICYLWLILVITILSVPSKREPSIKPTGIDMTMEELIEAHLQREATKVKSDLEKVEEKNDYLIKAENHHISFDNKIDLLEEIFVKADRNGNQLLETNELAEWIRLRVIEHITTSVRNNFGLFSIIDNNPKNNLVSWEEYHAYFLKKRGFNTDYIEKHDEIAHGGLKRPIKEQIMKDKAAWSEVIHSNPEGLTIDEFLTFTHPESSTTKMLALVEDLYDKFDCDGDEILTEDEFAVYQPEGDADNPLFIAKQNQDERRAEFRNAIDTNKDGKADKRELLMYVAPHNRRHSEHEAAALVAIADVNHDNALSFTEITANPDMFIKSKMVETAQSFHDEF